MLSFVSSLLRINRNGNTDSRRSISPSPAPRRNATAAMNNYDHVNRNRRHTVLTPTPSNSSSRNIQSSASQTNLNYLRVGNNGDQYVEALFNFQAQSPLELSFSAGQFLKILNGDSYDGWSKAVNFSTHQQGFIPKNYVKNVRQIETEPWYFGKITRNQSEEYLLQSCNVRGSYMVRVSERDPSCLALSIRDVNNNGRAAIKHYKIKTNGQGRFYISLHDNFPTIKALIDFHKTQLSSICHCLIEPCAYRPPRPNLTTTPPALAPRPFPQPNYPEIPATNEMQDVEDDDLYANTGSFRNTTPFSSSTDLLGAVGGFDFDKTATLPSGALLPRNAVRVGEEVPKIEVWNFENLEPQRPLRPPSIHTHPPPLLQTSLVPTSNLLGTDSFNDIFEDREEIHDRKREVEDKEQVIILQKLLGDGYFGDVWKGNHNGEEVTVLIIKSKMSPVPKQRKVSRAVESAHGFL